MNKGIHMNRGASSKLSFSLKCVLKISSVLTSFKKKVGRPFDDLK